MPFPKPVSDAKDISCWRSEIQSDSGNVEIYIPDHNENETIKINFIWLDFGRFNYILIFTSGLVMSTLITEMIGITFVLPVSQCDLHLSTSEKGVLGTAGFFGIICSSHLWGFLADTQGRRRIMQPTLLAAFLTSIISSFVQNFYLLTTLRFLNGFL